ncbi:MAG: selenium cofactor biosynthesis protein YqeC [Halofilum sp. (in: g-proteobacteria)]|nr:selenium cofactor biosynthesis protein YqeC [Halofilum sp. (in: g-proteobacteria)]
MSSEVQAAAGRERMVAWARPTEKSGRVAGIGVDEVAPCHAAGGFDVTYVKADGARMRGIKAPRADEPALPAERHHRCCPIVAATVIGRPLDETAAHRPERVAAVTGLSRRRADHGRRRWRSLLASPEGALQGVPAAARVVPVINAVDDAATRRARRPPRRRLALAASARFDRVVLTCHHKSRTDPLVAIIER